MTWAPFSVPWSIIKCPLTHLWMLIKVHYFSNMSGQSMVHARRIQYCTTLWCVVWVGVEDSCVTLMYIGAYMYMRTPHIRIHAHTHIHTATHTHLYTHIPTHSYTPTHTYTHTPIHRRYMRPAPRHQFRRSWLHDLSNLGGGGDTALTMYVCVEGVCVYKGGCTRVCVQGGVYKGVCTRGCVQGGVCVCTRGCTCVYKGVYVWSSLYTLSFLSVYSPYTLSFLSLFSLYTHPTHTLHTPYTHPPTDHSHHTTSIPQ